MSLTRAFLEIVEGPGLGRRVLLRDGQTLYVGRTDQADVSCPENPMLSSVHFSARWFAGQCEIKDLNSANGTWRSGKKVAEALLRSGEDIKAGKAVFRLVVDDGSAARATDVSPAADAGAELRPAGQRNDSQRSDSQRSEGQRHDHGHTHAHNHHQAAATAGVPGLPPPAESLPVGLALPQAAAVAAVAPLADASRTMLISDMTTQQFIDLLASREQFLDALRVVAHALAARSAVQWACQCVRTAAGDDLNPADSAALAAAEQWVADPSEANRRQAQAAAEAAEHKTPASWAAMAAFWSAGSLAPPSAPVVPPAPHLPAHAAAGAAMLAAVARQPEKATEKYYQFLQLGRDLMGSTPS
jgi:hypothetical protein